MTVDHVQPRGVEYGVRQHGHVLPTSVGIPQSNAISLANALGADLVIRTLYAGAWTDVPQEVTT